MSKDWEQYKEEVLKDYESHPIEKGDREAFLKIIAKKYKVKETTVWNRICSLRKKRKAQQLKFFSFNLGKFGNYSREGVINEINKLEKHYNKVKGKLRGDWPYLLDQLYLVVTEANNFNKKEINKIEKFYKDYNNQFQPVTKELQQAKAAAQLTQDDNKRKNIHPIKVTSNILLDENGKSLEFKPIELVDNNKLLTFCNTQYKRRKKIKKNGGMRRIHQALAELLNTTEATVCTRYYETKRNVNQQKNIQTCKDKMYKNALEENDLIKSQLSEAQSRIITLQEERNKLQKEILDLRMSEGKYVQQTNELTKLIEKLKRNPIVKFAYTLSKLGGQR